MKKLFIGPCPLCDTKVFKEEEIIIDGKKYHKAVLTEEGTHFFIKSNYGSRMKIAICKDCLKTLDMARVAQIIDDMVYTWFLELLENKELTEEKRRLNFNKIRFYVAMDFAETEEGLINGIKN